MTARAIRELTGPVEDYLKTIYELGSAGGVAGTNEIATSLGIAAPSVSGMLRRLARQGLVTHEPYKGVELTREGRRAALRTIRRHRVIESYLTQALGYPWDRVHDEAERLEHSASDELIDRMAAAIGEPATELVKVSDERGVDLIAMSTHGHRFIKDVIYGSVANEVRHLSRVPVLLVRGDRKPPQAISGLKAT